METRICKHCGKEFVPEYLRQICCTKECQQARSKAKREEKRSEYRKTERAKLKKYKAEESKKKNKGSSLGLVEKNAIAKKNGLSYGHMQALIDLKGSTWEDWA